MISILWEAEQGGSGVQPELHAEACLRKLKWGHSEVGECLPNMSKALVPSLALHTPKTQKPPRNKRTFYIVLTSDSVG